MVVFTFQGVVSNLTMMVAHKFTCKFYDGTDQLIDTRFTLNDKLSLNQQGDSRLAKDHRSIRGIIGFNDALSTN